MCAGRIPLRPHKHTPTLMLGVHALGAALMVSIVWSKLSSRPPHSEYLPRAPFSRARYLWSDKMASGSLSGSVKSPLWVTEDSGGMMDAACEWPHANPDPLSASDTHGVTCGGMNTHSRAHVHKLDYSRSHAPAIKCELCRVDLIEMLLNKSWQCAVSDVCSTFSESCRVLQCFLCLSLER